MSNDDAVLLPATAFDEADEPSLFIKFDPGTRVLPAGFQTLPHFQPIPVDMVLDKDVAVTLQDGTPPVRYSMPGSRRRRPRQRSRKSVPTRRHRRCEVLSRRGIASTEHRDAGMANYDAVSDRAGVSFTVGFGAETEVVGYPRVRLWVESDGSDDMDLFVLLQRLNAAGEPLEQFNVPNHGEVMDSLTRNGSSILKYKGSNGRLRVSMRHLDEATSSDAVPAHSFDRIESSRPARSSRLTWICFPSAWHFIPASS